MVTKIEIQDKDKKAKEALETEHKSEKERADLSLEVKEGERKKSVTELIEQLNTKESLTEQKESVSALETVLNALILKALNAGIKIDEIKKNPISLNRFASKSEETLAIKKLPDLLRDNKEYLRGWDHFCNKASVEFKKADEAKKALEDGKVPEGHDWMPTAVRAGLIIGGAIGAYNLWQWFKKPDTKEDPKKLPYISAALTTLGVGALIGPDRLGTWAAKYMGLSLGADALKKFWTNIKKWNFKEAFGSFLFSNENPGIQKASEKLDIDKSLLIDLKDVSYAKFHDFRSDTSRKTKSYIAEGLSFMGIDNSSNTIGTDVDDQIRNADKEQKLLDFIEVNKHLITDKDVEKMTISEILNEFDKLGILDKSTTGKTESSEKGKEKAEVGDMESLGSNFPHARATYEAYKNGDIGLNEAAKQLIDGTAVDASALVVKDGSLFLIKYGFVAYISSAAIWQDTIMDVYGMYKGEKGLTDWGVDMWDDGLQYWIGAGAVIGAVRSGSAMGGVIGGLKGFRMAYKFVPWSIKVAYKGGAKGLDEVKKLNFTVKETFAANDAVRAEVFKARAKFHAEEYEKFQIRNKNIDSPGRLTGVKDKVVEYIYPNWAKEEMIKNGQHFLDYRTKYLDLMEKIYDKAGDRENLAKIREAKVKLADLKLTPSRIKGEIEAGQGTAESELLTEGKRLGKETFRTPTVEEPAIKIKAPTVGAELVTLSESQLAELKALGFDENAILRVREMKIAKPELDELIGKCKKDPTLLKQFERLAAEAKYVKLFNAIKVAKQGLAAAVIILTIYEFDKSEDKTRFLMKNGTMIIAISGAFQASQLTVGARVATAFAGSEIEMVAVFGPQLGTLLSALIAVGVALGLDVLWEKYATPILEKYIPNSGKNWETWGADKTLSDILYLSGEGAFATYGYGMSKLNITGGVDEETDPVEYLLETSKIINPYAGIYDAATKGLDKFSLFQHYKKHDIQQFIKNSKTTLAEKKVELSEIDPNDTEEKTELENAIRTLESYVDGSWIQEREGALIIMNGLTLAPAYQEFKGMAQAKFGNDAFGTFNTMMGSIERGERDIADGEMMEMWQYLCDQKITIHGKDIHFIEFVQLAYALKKEERSLEMIKREVLGEGQAQAVA